jgi:hypothetical protein
MGHVRGAGSDGLANSLPPLNRASGATEAR